MDSIPLDFHSPRPSETLDFGRLILQKPSFVLKPKAPQDISLLLKYISSSSMYNNITVAARGAGHSVCGQAQALGGIVIDMKALPKCIRIGKSDEVGSRKDQFFVDVGGGALWVEVLLETLKHGLTPRSWTDYLFLTVGGTLSVGGISGQTFKHGPQICNVLEMDVITGKGEFVTCSKSKNSELFYAVLGGLGQFGIIVTARITLDAAPLMVKYVKVFYNDFSKFTKDQELLISMEDVDYVEGFMKLSEESEALDSNNPLESSSDSKRANVSYIIEIAVYYSELEKIQQTMDNIISQLSAFPSTVDSIEVTYFDFLNRVREEEQSLRRSRLWEVPHPWLNLFVPKSQINPFMDLLLNTISAKDTNGPILIYPILRHKWDSKMSTILPRDDSGEKILYLVGLLRSVVTSSSLQAILTQNQKIIDAATLDDKTIMEMRAMGIKDDQNPENDTEGSDLIDSTNNLNNIKAKQYIPIYGSEKEWKIHFGEEWETFVALKSKYDPLHILTPGQNIFKRKKKED